MSWKSEIQVKELKKGLLVYMVVSITSYHVFVVCFDIDDCDAKKADHLTYHDGAKEKLYLFKAHLLEEGTIDVVVDVCEGVFHTTSLFTMESNVHRYSLLTLVSEAICYLIYPFCWQVTISKDDTVILDGADDQKKSIEERCDQIKSAIELSTSDYDKECKKV
ncbi:hypothetical protein CQW23_21723 [Capsicum baccatum]|uniref:Uncharacterized protein n=1 Tax=Capsicum baccatum TaxID=33114 RepID=A0A2G2VYU3_CAPBA|nr:hypothetical protein CQW23_21723 [Capsicum baccatum]